MKFKFEITAYTKEGQLVAFDGAVEVGTAVYVVSQDGTKTPAPDGDLTFEDGTVVTVKDGAISELKEVQTEETMEENKEVVTEVKAEEVITPTFETQIAEFETKIKAEFASQIETLQNEINALKNDIASEKAVVEEKFKSVVNNSTEKVEVKKVEKTYAQEVMDKLSVFKK